MFDPAFEVFCEEEARQLDATRDDPWLLGTFSDNELPFQRECLANYLTFPEDDPGHKADQEWLCQKHGPGATAKGITEQDKKEFLGVVVDSYHRLVSQAIKRHDPRHLDLGSRLTGHALGFPEVFQALGPCRWTEMSTCASVAEVPSAEISRLGIWGTRGFCRDHRMVPAVSLP